MGLVEQAETHLKGKPIIIVTTSVDEDGFLQEIGGTLLEAIDGCFVLMQGEEGQEGTPTLVNADYVVWVYEDTGEEDKEEEDKEDGEEE